MKTRFTVEYTKTVAIELDTEHFTEEFMAEYREGFGNFHTLEEHAQHLGYLCARDEWGQYSDRDKFIEGYGPLNEMGIEFEEIEFADARVIDEEAVSA